MTPASPGYLYCDHFKPEKSSVTSIYSGLPKNTSFPLNSNSPTSKPYEDHSFFKYEDYALEEEIEKSNQNTPDGIENVTLQIFLHLASCADGKKRTDIEAVIEADTNELNSSLKATSSKLDKSSSAFFNKIEGDAGEKLNKSLNHLSSSKNPFLQEDYSLQENPFYENEENGLGKTFENLTKTLSTINNLLFKRFWTVDDDQMSTKEICDMLQKDYVTWNISIKQGNYLPYFHEEMEIIFQKAKEMVDLMRDYEKGIYRQRITLLVTLVISALGSIFRSRIITMLGLTSFVIAMIYMITQYRFKSMKIAEERENFTNLVEKALAEAAKARIYPEPF